MKTLKTHCKQGHPLSGDNLYIRPDTGQRTCRECQRKHQRAYDSKHDRYRRACERYQAIKASSAETALNAGAKEYTSLRAKS